MQVANNNESASSINQWMGRVHELIVMFVRLLLLIITEFFQLVSPTFICYPYIFLYLETYGHEYLKGMDVTARILVNFASKYSLYSIYFPGDEESHHRVTLNLSTFSTLLMADLPYCLAYIDLEWCSSLFTTRGFGSFIICCLSVSDIVVFNGRSQQYLRMRLYSQWYWQSCIRSLVFVGLIVVGVINMIVKAWHGALVFHKHVLIPLSLCVFSFIRFNEKYHRLRRMMKKAMIVVPVEEKDECEDGMNN